MKYLLLALSIGFIGCADSVNIDTHGKRITDLERRADLNDELDKIQSDLIELNASGIALANSRIDQLDSDLRALLAAEEAARISGDQALASALGASILAQTLVNLGVQYQLSLINSKFPLINSKLSSLQNQMNSANSSISNLQSQINILNVEVAGLEASVLSLESDVSNLEDDVNNLQLQLDQEGVKVYKCNLSTSKENVFKINGKFYAVMNHVTLTPTQVITGSSSSSYSTPFLCKNNGDSLKLASGGSCGGGGWSLLSGTGLSFTVPSYTSTTVNLVSKVQMALEKLGDGSYSTTDGTAPCHFSISGGGSSSSNLIQAQ